MDFGNYCNTVVIDEIEVAVGDAAAAEEGVVAPADSDEDEVDDTGMSMVDHLDMKDFEVEDLSLNS